MISDPRWQPTIEWTDPETTWVSHSEKSQLSKQGPLGLGPIPFLMALVVCFICNPYHPWLPGIFTHMNAYVYGNLW